MKTTDGLEITITPSKPRARRKKNTRKELEGFHLVDDTTGIILDGIWVKDDGTELIIRSPFWGGRYLHFRSLNDGENSL